MKPILPNFIISEEEYEHVLSSFRWNEITLSIYLLGRVVIKNICPEKLDEFPEYDYSAEQEYNLLTLLAELQDNPATKDKYQEI